jgi:hypothetical protein
VKQPFKSDRPLRVRRRACASALDILLGRGRQALRDHSIKMTIGDYIRVLTKEHEPQPTGKTVWFDDLDHRT